VRVAISDVSDGYEKKESGAIEGAGRGRTENRNMKKSKQKTHLTPNEVAELLMVNPVTVRQWAARGLLRSLTTPGGHRRFLLSDVEEFARSRGATPVARHSGRPDRVLIVDDDLNVSRLIQELIHERDANVETEIARDGFEAGVKVESFRPHALVLDLMMPGMDGFEVCRRLRARPTLNHIRIVAVTGFPSTENVDRILAAGADACLEKPVDSERLLMELGLMAEKGAG
jgi:excisionase family DNA binding protein